MRRPLGAALVVLSFAGGLGLAVRAWANFAADPAADFGPTPAAARAARDAGFGPAPQQAESPALAEVSDGAFGPAPEVAAVPLNDPFGKARARQLAAPPTFDTSDRRETARGSDDPFGGLDAYQSRPTRTARPTVRPFCPDP